MFLTNEQARRFQEHLRAVNARGDCHCCNKPIDRAANAELLAWNWSEPNGTPASRLYLACTCPHCAVVEFFDAAGIDL